MYNPQSNTIIYYKVLEYNVFFLFFFYSSIYIVLIILNNNNVTIILLNILKKVFKNTKILYNLSFAKCVLKSFKK